MLPLIGITCSTELDRFTVTQYYSQGVEKAGGLPILLPVTEKTHRISFYADLLQGLILTGGGDVDPVYMGQEPEPGMGQITPERDNFELLLTKYFLDQGKPILAICRGMQVLNIIGGGTIWQDLNSQCPKSLKHSQEAPKWYPTHEIHILAHTKLSSIFTGLAKTRVNSFHHQAVQNLGEEFMVSALAQDGIIEAIESKTANFQMGVQWHPECMWEKNPLQLELFKALILACQG
ncbi:gamma-glutamyl-gamma-aminobutyrate hydrolase family protein [Bacillota bacterium LX-D]|nr:gamma-glutamyl-gamma-aminobutyrate hydrolase family protein [Bacillota bacterium LX-D]